MRRRRLAEALRLSERFGDVGPEHTATWDSSVIDSTQLIEFADAWAGLGNAVQDQVRAVMDDSGTEDVNSNALELAVERIGQWHQDIDVALDEALNGAGRSGADDDEDDGSLEYARRVNGMD